WQKSDKASVINSILGLEVETDKYFVKSVKKDGEVNGRKITLINTACWWEKFSLQDSPEVIKQEVACSVFLCETGPHVFLIVINLSLPFTEENRLSIEEHLGLFEDVWRHTIVLFTWGDRFPDISIEQHIESEGDALQWLVEKCRNRYHVFDNSNKNNRDQVTELLQKIDEMVAENSLFCFNTQCAAEKNIHETDTQDEEISLDADHVLQLLQMKHHLVSYLTF
uniref:AIG1-type G domain-containing protein n=1 Tax=Sinocyclocheilus anshuiensis TaxID=1608454 RepID=A0A671R5R2_9TELE